MEHVVAKTYKDIHHALLVPCENCYFFDSLVIKNIVVPSSSWFRFPAKLLYCVAFGSASSTCCLLKSIDTILK